MVQFKFAYSYDRETFNGQHDTRQDALKTGLAKAPEQDTPPETVYVGKRVPVDPGSSGLAEMVLGAMRRRVRETTGDNSAADSLVRVNEHQLAELDDELDRVIRAWLSKHELTPTQSKVIAISEHPVPQPAMKAAAAASSKNGSGEVNDLGESDYPVTLF